MGNKYNENDLYVVGVERAPSVPIEQVNEVRRYDNEKFLVSLQGVLNREKPVLYLKECEDFDHSQTYLKWLTSKGEILEGRNIVELADRDAIFEVFGDKIAEFGLVVWDPDVPATSNLAATICGVEDYIPVIYDEAEDSLYQYCLKRNIPVKMNLCNKFTGKGIIPDINIPSKGTAKLDAYVWAMEKYLKPGRCSREYIAYMCDFYPISKLGKTKHWLDNSIYATYLPDQDFMISKRAFFVDLDMFSHEAAGDDPGQKIGDDYHLLCNILEVQYHLNNGEFSQCVGFAPFVYKYCLSAPDGGKEDAVMSEFVLVEVMTAYNIVLQADCPGPSSIHNCSVYTHSKMPEGYKQDHRKPKELPEYDPDKRYITIYFGDYDAASWTATVGIWCWEGEGRGSVPLAWGFNPNLVERIPHVFRHFLDTATDQDVFVAGDSGAGYINPNLLQEGKRRHSELPDGLDAWVRWCEKWYKPLDISVTPFILNGNNGLATDRVLNAYSKFSYDGIGLWNWPGKFSGYQLAGNTAVTGLPQNIGLDQCADAETNSKHLLRHVNEERELPFYQLKCNRVPAKLAADTIALAQEKDPRIVPLDVYTFYAMIRRELQK